MQANFDNLLMFNQCYIPLPFTIMMNKGIILKKYQQLLMQPKQETLIDTQNTLSKNPSMVSEPGKPLDKSNVSLKIIPTPDELQNQIVQLKQKAHQSFMQVIQMQQLHEQELQQLRNQFSQKESEYQLRLGENEVRIKQLEYENSILDKNYRHHTCDIDQDDLEIDNIELITCREESKLDDSAITTFQEIIDSNAHQERINAIKLEIRTEIQALDVVERNQIDRVLAMVQKTFDYLTYLKQQFVGLHERNLQMQRMYEQNESKTKNNKNYYDSIQKQTKFMTQHIKRLSNDKMKVQKKLLQTQRSYKTLQDKLKKIQTLLNKRGIKMEQIFGKPKINNLNQQDEHDRSLDINQFIQLNFTKMSNISQLPPPKQSSPFIKNTGKH